MDKIKCLDSAFFFCSSFSLTSVVRKVNLFHFSCIHQWKTILGPSFKITLNVIIWFQVSKTLITFEGRCLNDIPWSYIQFVLLRQQPRKTFADRNTMYSLNWYAMNIISKGNSTSQRKDSSSFVTDTVGQYYIYISHMALVVFSKNKITCRH